MFYGIVTNMEYQRKPWEDIPIEIIIEYERKRKEQQQDHRERLYVP